MNNLKKFIFLICFGSSVYLLAEKADDDNHEIIENKDDNQNIDNFDEDDEKLLENIFNIISDSYVDLIDITAIYFSGLDDSDRWYNQIINLIHKKFFKIIKLFAWYVPAILKNKKNSKFIKLKKLSYVTFCIMLFWYTSKVILLEKTVHRGFKIDLDSDSDDASLKPRQRPGLYS